MSERIYIANSNSLLLFQSQSRESIFEAHPQRFQTTGKPDLSKASFLASLLLPDFDRWSHDRNTAELHRRAGIRRVAPFIPTQALRLWVGYSRRWRIIFHDGTGLLDCDLQIVRRHAIHRHIHVHFAAPCQAAWQRHIEL